MNKSIRVRTLTGTALALAVTTVLTACGGGNSSASGTTSDGTLSATPPVAVRDPLVATFDGGLYILDGKSLKLAKTIDLPGFNRINPAGDQDHVVVSTDSGFRVLNATDQALTDIEYQGSRPGHVVRHATKTVLFTDGTDLVVYHDAEQYNGLYLARLVPPHEPHLSTDDIEVDLDDAGDRTRTLQVP